MKKRISSLLMALLMTASAFVSCADDEPDDTKDNVNESEVSNESESESKETTWLDTLPADVYYDDYKFHIGWSSPNSFEECDILLDDVEVGDIVDQAVYDRNLMAEEKLGIVISAELMCDAWTDVLSTASKLQQSGDNPYDVYCVSVWPAYNCSVNGLLVELGGVDTIDVTHSWWDQSTTEMHRMGSKSLYFLNGDINYSDDYATSAIFYDKQLAEENGLPNIYDMVRNDTWTFDEMVNMIQIVARDIDGLGYGDGDIFGYTDNSGLVSRLLCAFGENLILIDEEGNASVNTGERCINIFDKVFDRLCGSQASYTVLHGEFSGVTVLFTPSDISSVNGRRSSERDFGIIPYPKYDELQERYYTIYNNAYSTVYCIPIDNRELDRTGNILEVMGAYSHETIHESVVEKAVLVKGVRDEDSAEMIELLFDSRFYEIGLAGTNIYNSLCNMVEQGKNTFSSTAKAQQKLTANAFKALKEYYDYSK